MEHKDNGDTNCDWSKGLVKGPEELEIRGQIEIIQATVLLRSARILGRVLETWGDLLSLNLQREVISQLSKE